MCSCDVESLFFFLYREERESSFSCCVGAAGCFLVEPFQLVCKNVLWGSCLGGGGGGGGGVVGRQTGVGGFETSSVS